MVNNLRWAELLTSIATDLSPFVKSLGKFEDNLHIYGIGTGIAGLEGMNQIIKETRAAYGIWMRPDQEHTKPSLARFAFGVVNAAGYGLYGAGAAGFLGRYGTGGGLLLVTASNVLKQHFLPAEQTYRPDDPVLPLHPSDTAANLPPAAARADVPELVNIARYARALLPAPPTSPDPLIAPLAAPDPNDRWLQAGAMETGMVRPVPSGPRSQVQRPLTRMPVTDAAGGAPEPVNPVAATAGASPYRQGWSRSLPDIKTAPPAHTETWRRGTTEYAVTSSRSASARRRTR
ncbi:hypothetical protein [Streptomyces sp. NPDC049744]|uniref:hypothetical protein n=1 Tax=Streptomyces sp. NPDC049744 TaxID=3154359 RepID=UPI003416D2C1